MPIQENRLMHKQEKRLMSGIQRPLMCASRLRPIQYTQCYAVKGQKAGDSFDDSETDDMDCSMTSSTERRKDGRADPMLQEKTLPGH